MKEQILYKTAAIDGLEIFYREAGTAERPLLLLLHGFPSSSHMYRDLIADLSEAYHIIAPDYPGFGQSSMPGIKQFSYTFDNLSVIMERFIDHLQLRDINLYIQDYGGPIGLRIATRRPQLIQSLIIQNANAYNEGLGDALEPLITYIQQPDAAHEQAARFFLTLEATRWLYLNGAHDQARISPDSYITDQYYLDRAGNDEIQLALFLDYGNNLALYDEWHAYFKKHQPKTMVVWGKNDALFIAPGGEAYRKDLPNAEIIQIDGGHFLLEEHHAYVAGLINRFIS
ncbi:Pimeloyl-ACP methyl ester carboxylesterase [Filimonas lacunae]|uniref:Pimeloyl-ACP methyl ester carboxylesterase n=1 Tax=Filimonas lacunae TaxID=477680 RepID=A0A173MC52_9BACT|nr:alpha/beta hydrolase [Filimonas lacunae]BAV05031.1 alpha/beta hydrolase fold [Filimonas lacunae]SIT33620.1 Pimeloyl-ACP methyl ester carboxylesterase [Filimonas lacunae]